MKTLLRRETDIEIGPEPEMDFGPDPVMLRKRGLKQFASRDINDFKSRINDDAYLTHAIDRIAVELMHHLVK